MRSNVLRIDDYNQPHAASFKTKVKGIVQEWQREDIARQLHQAKLDNERLMDYVFELTWRIKNLEEKSNLRATNRRP